jgi:CRP/FNR family transcriptional regulator
MIPVEKMGKWIEQYQSWRSFVFDSYNIRFNELLESIDNLAFRNMHDRIHKYLKDKSLIVKSKIVEGTHQEIAYDLNTSRVVVSRLLKSLEKEGKVKLSRNKIEMLSGFFA